MAIAGLYDFGQRFVSMARGLRTEFGTFAPPGGQVVAYVHSSGVAKLGGAAAGMPPVLTTLNAALKLCAAGNGDTVLVLPGHAENISAADQMSSLVAGTRIIGLGNGMNRPTFTWTAAAATFLLDVANVRLENCILNMDPGAGTVTVAAPITISAAGVQIVDCKIRMGTDVNSTVTIGITTTAAADDLELVGLDVYGAQASVITTAIRLVGADRLRMVGCSISAGTSANAVGVVQFLTTASTDILVSGCYFRNNKAAATHSFTGMAGCTGIVDGCIACTSTAIGIGDSGFNTLGTLAVGLSYISRFDGTSTPELFPGA